MVNTVTVTEILESYENIQAFERLTDHCFKLLVHDRNLLFYVPSCEDVFTKPAFYLKDDIEKELPHILCKPLSFKNNPNIPDGEYRLVCLYEYETLVNAITPWEEKVRDAIDRLCELLEMNEYDQKKEFQKEFELYWNNNATGGGIYDVYLSQDSLCGELDLYQNKSSFRLVEKGIYLNDIDRYKRKERIWKQRVDSDIFYIPIENSREILPPHKGYSWQLEDIRKILYPKQINYVSSNILSWLDSRAPSAKNVILVFGMNHNKVTSVFAVKIKCQNNVKRTLREKLLCDSSSVEILYTKRKDYQYLSRLIGNEMGLLKKKVLLVGCGSLGSYVGIELMKNGVTNLTVYDSEKIEIQNTLRWVNASYCFNSYKVDIFNFLANGIHQQLKVNAVNKSLTETELEKIVDEFDLIIFTIGSSDEQLKFNRTLRRINCKIPAIFVWLEAGGDYSHILKVDYSKKGCYECLFTDEDGSFVNNRGTINTSDNESDIIRNGCGGTRAAYGTATLLRTTAALLGVLKCLYSENVESNFLMDITPMEVKKTAIKFPIEHCKCCGNG